MQGLILPITDGMTVEKAIAFCNLDYEITERAVYFKCMDSYPIAIYSKIRSICPNCQSSNVLPIVFYNEENSKLAEERKVIIAPGAYGSLGVPMGNYGCGDCGYRWYLDESYI